MRAAVLEHIVPDFDSSFRLLPLNNTGPHCLNYWHYHPEYELVYIDRGSATRHIGNSIDRYENGDLILVGSNLPHRSFTEDLIEPHTEIVVQWRPDFLGEGFFEKPECKKIKTLLDRSQNGLSFGEPTKTMIGELLLTLDQKQGFDRMYGFLDILKRLALSEDYHLLDAAGVELIFRPNDQERIEAIFNYVKVHYSEAIILEEVAKEVNMTKQSFCRYFKQCTALTFFEFVNKYRISQAVQQLANSADSIGAISFNCGFNNLSTFNKQFKKRIGMAPLNYRKTHQRILQPKDSVNINIPI